MPASILSLGTAVPDTAVEQRTLRDLFARQPGLDRRAQRIVHAAFDASAIDRRHTVLPELGGAAPHGLSVRDEDVLRMASTRERNDAYIDRAPGLFAAAATVALGRAGIRAPDVTHVVTASCTGVMAPGPDFRLVRDLGLPPSTERYHLGFVGCAAAVPLLRAAERIVRADPDAVVLVAAAELCSLHLQISADPDQIVAASVFADGAGAAVVADDRRAAGRRIVLDRFATGITAEGEDDMAWRIGESGFRMTLTPEVPRIVGREIAEFAHRAFAGADIAAWAVHPGGRSILDRVESALSLPSDALADSRAVLREYGNMSSATLLFILERMLRDGRAGGTIGALAFGPGITVESAVLHLRDADTP